MLSVKIIQANLSAQELGSEITYYPITDSTNVDLWKLVEQNEASPGQVVVTDDQHAGRGRQGRHWFSAPSLGLTFSVLLYHELPMRRSSLLALAAGVAVVDALEMGGLQAGLKWPNDILVDHSKLGGILAESRNVGARSAVVLGIGLNVNEELTDFPEELQSTAVSVRMALGHIVQRETLLARILNRLEELIIRGLEGIPELWHTKCTHIGEVVRFHGPDELIEGIFLGVDQTGGGILEIGDQVRVITAGDLEWARDPT
jgi:BirA family biotin operon repressor/biotin-[acetyl-CoA-carboxylase] ligase